MNLSHTPTTSKSDENPTPAMDRKPEGRGLALKVVPATFGICRLSPQRRIPRWVHRSVFYSISRSPDELSIVCEQDLIPQQVRCEGDWKAIRVLGPLDLSMIGVLHSLAGPLTRAGISIFFLSTFDTDYLLVREKNLRRAVSVLEAAGHRFDVEPVKAASPAPAPAEPRETGPREAGPRKAEPSEAGPREAEAQPEPREAERETEPQEAGPVEAGPLEAGPREAESATAGEDVESAAPPADGEGPDAEERVDVALSELFASFRGSSELAAGEPAPGELAAGEPAAVEEATPEQAAPGEEKAAAEAEPEEQAAAEAAPEEAVAEEVEATAEAAPEDAGELGEPPAREEGEEAEEFPPAAAGDEGADASGLFSGAIPQEQPVALTEDSFEALGLSEAILESVRQVGFEHPTPIQMEVVPRALEGHDVIGLAETGSGKTAAFALPLAERLTHGTGIRGLILSPTREIALQTKAFLDTFGRDHDLETVLVIGGVKMGPQIAGFRRQADIIVATPGRLADHLRRGNVNLEQLEELVLDEADHMLDLGFLPQIREILEQAPVTRRTMMFSATMPAPIARLAKLFMRDPVRVDLRPEEQVASGIEHRLYLVREEDMKACVIALLREVPGSTLIFTRRKLYTEWLARQLELAGFEAARIHSDRSQAQRVRALKGFREGRHRILAATDVAARGLDIPRIQHVINYSLPETVEDYVHRAGRTARGSAVGIVSTIGTWQDKTMVRDIELTLGIEMPRCTVEGVEPYVELPKRKTVRRRRLL